MSNIQDRANAMMKTEGFQGVPLETFETGGRLQFMRLLEHGLVPESRVLEIGCGCLRIGYWLVRLLEPGGYSGIEPAKSRVDLGKSYLFDDALLAAKRPEFDYNADFDTSVFDGKFDYFLACSIWTHCSKAHIETMLDGFLANTRDDAVFLASYLPARDPKDDYTGDVWVGTSHESSTPGIVYHALDWIVKQCRARGLKLTEIPGIDLDGQFWLRIERGNAG